MNVSELLREEHSRAQTDFIADVIFNHPDLFPELWKIFMKNEEPLSRRAAWVADVCSQKNPVWIAPLLRELIETLPGFIHDGMKRHALRILARSPLPAGKLGELTDICFGWLLHRDESVATKVYCMEILYRISEAEPDLKPELADSISLQLMEGTPGTRVCGNRLLKKLSREISHLR
jgi:hypothetical protein